MLDPAQVSVPTGRVSPGDGSPVSSGDVSRTPLLFTKMKQTFLGQGDFSSRIRAALVMDTVVPNLIADSLNPLNPVGGAAKEAKDLTFTVEKPAVDVVPGMQYVEHEDNYHEMPPEVEAFVEKVEDHQAQLPHEVVIADNTTPTVTPHYVSQPVIVLPITPEIEKEGEKKSPLLSIRWLVEWSHKVMKMFSGRVVYRQQKTT